MKRMCRSGFIGLFFASLCVCAVFLSCASMGGDARFSNSFTTAEKAELLFQQGKSLYENDILKGKDFTKIAAARTAFESALEIDQYHPLAPIYLEKLNAYADSNLDKYVSEAEELLAKESRTSKEDYTLLRDIKRAEDISASSAEVTALRRNARQVQSAFTSERTARLEEITREIAVAERAADIGGLASEAEGLFSELEAVGAYGSTQETQRAVIETNLMRIVSDDMEKAETFLTKRQYGEVNKTVTAVERTLKNYYSTPVSGVEDFKYRFYVQWVGALISVEAYRQADRTADMAIAIDPTEEALAYKQQIARKLEEEGAKTAAAPAPSRPRRPAVASTPKQQEESGPDYDAEIKSICDDIDRLIMEDKMVEAWNLIAEVKPSLKLASSISAIENKEANIYKTLPGTYSGGISAYNSEDYETAIKHFRTVAGIAPDYEQVQAYLERSVSRLKILSGAE